MSMLKISRLLSRPVSNSVKAQISPFRQASLHERIVYGEISMARRLLAQLAGPSRSCVVDDFVSKEPSCIGLFCRKIVVDQQIENVNLNNKIYVCVPTKNSVKKINDYLEKLLRDLKAGGETADFDIELFIFANGCCDGTEAKILHALVNNEMSYKATILISRESRGKSAAINALKAEVDLVFQRDRARKPGIKPYIFFSDDDIVIKNLLSAGSGVCQLVELLEKHELSAASGNYYVENIGLQVSHPLKSFWRYLNGVRRRYVVGIQQIYGGGWVCRLDQFPAGGVPENLVADDCYLSLHFFHRGGVRSFPGVLLLVPLPETLIDSCGRWLRDSGAWQQLKSYVLQQGLFSDAEILAFHEARKESFSIITDLIRMHSHLHPQRIANWLNWQIRQALMWLQEKKYVSDRFRPDTLEFYRIQQPSSLQGGDVGVTAFEQYSYLQKKSWLLVDGAGLDEDQSRILKQPGLAGYDRLKKLEQLIADPELRSRVENAANHQPLLKSWLAMVDYLASIRLNLNRPAFIRNLLANAGLPLEGEFSVTPIESGMIGFSYIISNEKQSLFVKYSDALGKIFPPIFEERREIYHQLLGDKLVSDLVGPQYAIEALYPSLEQARANLSVPELGSQRVLNRLIVKEDLSGRFWPYDEEIARRTEPFSRSYLAQARLASYAEVLGKMHARSVSLRRQYLAGHREGLAGYLFDIKDELVGVNPADHRHWLENTNYMFSHIRRRLSGSPVLAKRWRKLAVRSAAALAQYGTIGHFDYNPNDVMVGREKGEIKIFDFKRVGFTDPALEAATALSRRLRCEWRKNGFSEREIVSESQKIINNFLADYLVPIRVELGEKTSRSIEQRICEFCGFLVLNLQEGERQRFENPVMANQSFKDLAGWLFSLTEQSGKKQN